MSPPLLSNTPGQFAKSLSETRRRIEAAALRYARDLASVNLLAVSKQQSVERVRSLAALGQRDFGESYLQEAVPKIAALQDLPLIWHFIGQVQSNKTKPIAEHFDWVHTVDRLRIAERLSEQRPTAAVPLNICIQVKLADEAGKGGVALNEAHSLARSIAMLPRIRLRGLMCIPPPTESFETQSAYFKRTADLFGELTSHGVNLDTLSMGMSADLEAAIASGSTMVRVGTAIFGERLHRDERRGT
jgi:pyridoxal phosphate enzyme (YggS family)